MTNKRNKRDRAPSGRIGAILRILAPGAVLLLTTVSLFIPCLRFTTADTGTGKVISAAALLDNAWSQVREFLFGAGELSSVNELFSRIVLILIIVSVLLYLLGSVATVWWTAGALAHLRDPREEGTARALFVTLFPNRIATCLWQALLLPLTAFPRLLMLCYDRVLYYPVILNVTFAEPLLIGGILYLLLVLLTLLTRSRENEEGSSPYREKRRKERTAPAAREPEERSYLSPDPEGEDVSEIARRSREEQAERIRQLLSRRDKTENDRNNE